MIDVVKCFKITYTYCLADSLPVVSEELPEEYKRRFSDSLLESADNENERRAFLDDSKNPFVQEKIKPVLPAKRHPSAILYNVRKNVTEEEVQEALAVLTESEDKLKIRFKFRGRKEDTLIWVLETPDPALKKLKARKFLVNWVTVETREFYHVTKCNYCQNYGHVTKECSHTKPTCDNYPTKNCRKSSYICPNCSTYNRMYGANENIFHKAHSSACHCYFYEVQKYKKIRDYV
ncbi:hypothetical protein AVEN_236448-1 [Araneus ventricosus]|uniref:CCHC-type domain-containing protein n=1 Tax=Araneus ventricosus TaxID=182803 RepID=A0A4Y2IUC8_ARAVE|nr:hypothetical protein AVEN_236448-1 [Araneus ventricosus]